MPRSRLDFKENRLVFEIEDVEFTVGPEIVKVGRLKGELDVNDLLRTRLPHLVKGPVTGVKLYGFAQKKIQVIKETRSLTELGLMATKRLVEGTPVTIFPGMRVPNPAGGDDEVSVCFGLSDMKAYVEAICFLDDCHAEIEYGDATGPSVMDCLRDMLTEALGKEMK
jgi:hypothetical protein